MRALDIGRGWPEGAALRDLETFHLLPDNIDPDQLEAAFGELRQARGLKTLRVSSNLRVLPAAICDLETLHELEIYDSELPGLPSEIARLTRLRLLKLETFHLGSLPNSIGKLKKLQTLHVESHHLHAIPEQLRMLTGLRTLTLLLKSVYVHDWEEPGYFRARFEQPLDDLFSILASLPALSSLTLGEPGYGGREAIFDRLPDSFAAMPALESLRFVDLHRAIEIPRGFEMPTVREIVMDSAHFKATDSELAALFPNARFIRA